MILERLIIFLIWFLIIVILISILFYNKLRVRDFYFSPNSSVADFPGDAIQYTATSDSYFTTRITNAGDLTFRPLYSDRNRYISGGLVLLTYSTAAREEYYRIRVMNGSVKLSEAIYRIDPKLCYNNVNFSVDKGEDRKITFEIQKVNNKTNKTIIGTPSGINLVKAWSYYY